MTDDLEAELERDGVDVVRRKRAMGNYHARKLPIVDLWLRQKAEEAKASERQEERGFSMKMQWATLATAIAGVVIGLIALFK